MSRAKSIGTATTHNSNIDPLTFHFALAGLVYVLTYFIITGAVALFGEGSSNILWGMMFVIGMAVGYRIT